MEQCTSRLDLGDNEVQRLLELGKAEVPQGTLLSPFQRPQEDHERIPVQGTASEVWGEKQSRNV